MKNRENRGQATVFGGIFQTTVEIEHSPLVKVRFY